MLGTVLEVGDTAMNRETWMANRPTSTHIAMEMTSQGRWMTDRQVNQYTYNTSPGGDGSCKEEASRKTRQRASKVTFYPNRLVREGLREEVAFEQSWMD